MNELHQNHFGHGPCLLPLSVAEEVAQALLNFNGNGFSMLDVSPNTNQVYQIMNENVLLLRELLNVPQDYQVVFLQGMVSREVGVSLTCDMSSDIFSRTILVSDFDLIYAQVQKSLGPAVAAMTMVIIKKELINTVINPLLAISDCRIMVGHDSFYNDTDVFSIYIMMLNLRWLKSQGGVKEMEKLHRQKAELLYHTIDSSELFYATVDEHQRSGINVIFSCHEEGLEQEFVSYAKVRGVVGLKGDNSVGGLSVLLYNALPLDSVAYLCQLMRFFQASVKLKRKRVLASYQNIFS